MKAAGGVWQTNAHTSLRGVLFLLPRLLPLHHSFILHLVEMLFSSDSWALFCSRQEPQDAMGKP